MVVYCLLMYGRPLSSAFGLFTLLGGVIAYSLSIYLHYAVAYESWLSRHRLLLFLAATAFVVGYISSGYASLWIILTSWCSIVVAAFLAGRMTAAGRTPLVAYVTGGSAVVVFITLQYMPLWPEIMRTASAAADTAVADMKTLITTLGMNANVHPEDFERTRRVFRALIRIMPASTVLGALVPYTVGYLLFARKADKTDASRERSVPFVQWRIPFAVTPVLVAAMLMRLLGGESLTLIADNVLFCLAVFYSVAGLALIEFYLQRLRIPPALRILVYVGLFLAHIVSYFLTIVLGFIDSFADWRKRTVSQAG